MRAIVGQGCDGPLLRRPVSWGAVTGKVCLVLAADIGRIDGGSPATQRAVPPVLDGVLATPGQHARDQRPAVSVFGLLLDNDGVLGWRPLARAEFVLEVVVETLPALLTSASRYVKRDERPVITMHVIYGVDKCFVLGRSPECRRVSHHSGFKPVCWNISV